jgi:hypothetical protein
LVHFEASAHRYNEARIFFTQTKEEINKSANFVMVILRSETFAIERKNL